MGGYDINSFRKGVTLNKAYIFNRMKGNPAYGLYVPDNTDPQKLSRNFLLSVSENIYIFLANRSYRS